MINEKDKVLIIFKNILFVKIKTEYNDIDYFKDLYLFNGIVN